MDVIEDGALRTGFSEGEEIGKRKKREVRNSSVLFVLCAYLGS